MSISIETCIETSITDGRPPRPVVVIPIYRHDLNNFERLSLLRTFSVLGGHPIVILAPRSKQAAIQQTLETLIPCDPNYQWHIVNDQWLASHQDYNQLMLKRDFYENYKAYSHLLICQLDAYIFEDQLLDWCNQPYDYIGGPLYLPNAPYCPEELFCVGVGGFSLRRLQPIIRLLKENPIIFRTSDFRDTFKRFNIKARTFLFSRFLLCRLVNGCRLEQSKNRLSQYLGINEDAVFARYLPRYVTTFRIPDSMIGTSFCIDKHVKLSLADLGGHLPFAAHAWWTNPENLAEWSDFIPSPVY